MPFRSLLGHHLTLSLLSRATAAGTLPPSLIFAGPEGVGKRAAALALAQALDLPDPGGADRPAGAATRAGSVRCAAASIAACIPMSRSSSPARPGRIKIDVVREVIRQTTFKPFEARRRVIIFNDADGLVDDAQNALLKTWKSRRPDRC